MTGEFEVLINGSTLTDQTLSFKVERNLNERSYLNLKLINDPEISVSEGDDIVVKVKSHTDTLTKIFRGKVIKTSKGSQEGDPILEVDGVDLLDRLDELNVYKSYTNTTGKEICLDLLSVVPEIGTSTVGNCTTLLDFTAKGKTRLEALKDLGFRVRWDWYLDTDNNFHFFERDSIDSGKTIRLEDLENYSYKKDRSSIVNRIIVLGAEHTIPDPPGDWSDSLDGWEGNPTDPILVGQMEDFPPRLGKYAISEQVVTPNTFCYLKKTFPALDLSKPWSPKTLNIDIGFKTEVNVDRVYLILEEDSSNYFYREISSEFDPKGGAWRTFRVSVGPEATWDFEGSPHWDSISAIKVLLKFPSSTALLFVDRVYFSGARYHGFAEDSVSQTNYGVCEPPHVVKDNIYSNAECQTLAEKIIEENKTPKEIVEDTTLYPGWEDLELGSKVTLEIPEGTFTKRVLKLVHNYANGDFSTDLTLSQKTRTLSEILQEHDQGLEQERAEKEEYKPGAPAPNAPSRRRVILEDVLANRPPAGIQGRLFHATDTDEWYYDNGTSWELADTEYESTDVTVLSVSTGIVLVDTITGLTINVQGTGLTVDESTTGITINGNTTGVSIYNASTGLSVNLSGTDISVTYSTTGITINTATTGLIIDSSGTSVTVINNYTGESIQLNGTGITIQGTETGITVTQATTGLTVISTSTGLTVIKNTSDVSVNSNTTGATAASGYMDYHYGYLGSSSNVYVGDSSWATLLSTTAPTWSDTINMCLLYIMLSFGSSQPAGGNIEGVLRITVGYDIYNVYFWMHEGNINGFNIPLFLPKNLSGESIVVAARARSGFWSYLSCTVYYWAYKKHSHAITGTDHAHGVTEPNSGTGHDHSVNDPSHSHSTNEGTGHSHPTDETAHSHGVTEPNAGQGHSHGIDDPGHGHSVNDPKHSHSTTDSGHYHSVNEGYGHQHGVNDPQHGHTVSDPGHGHGVSDSGHTHTVTEPNAGAGHDHPVTDPQHSHSVSDPGHAHDVDDPGHSHSVDDPTHKHKVYSS